MCKAASASRSAQQGPGSFAAVVGLPIPSTTRGGRVSANNARQAVPGPSEASQLRLDMVVLLRRPVFEIEVTAKVDSVDVFSLVAEREVIEDVATSSAEVWRNLRRCLLG